MYLTPKQAQKQYGYHPKTLAYWAEQGKASTSMIFSPDRPPHTD